MFFLSSTSVCLSVCLSVGVLLPGQKLSFPFVFKSPNTGIFTETWALQTKPVLAAGQALNIILKGVAFEEDKNEPKRKELDVSLIQ